MKLNKFKILIPVLFVALFMQGCIEIGEEVTVNKDKSGHIDLSVSLNEGGFLLGIFGKYVNLSALDEIDRQAEQAGWILRGSEGISNVEYNFNKRSGKIRLSFDFENHRDLNKALYAMAGAQKTFLQPSVYKVRKNSLVKKNMTTWFKLLVENELEGSKEEFLLDLVEVHSVYHLPEPVKSVSDHAAVISDGGTTVTTSAWVADILDKKMNTGIRIRY